MTAEEVDVTAEGDGGVTKKVLRRGHGDEVPSKGSTVSVHYVGTLLNGSEFDSSRKRGTPFEFTLGKGSVIKGWDVGVATMRRGELCVLRCSPQYAYGEMGSSPRIPPNATLLFEVELLDWRDEDLSPEKDGGVLRRQVVTGEGYGSPNDGALVDVWLKGSCQGKTFEERDVRFCLGEGAEHGICPGVDVALEKFRQGERSILTLQPQYGFGESGNPSLGVPPNSVLQYEVELRSFEKAKEVWELDAEQKVEQARLSKEKGTVFFKKANYPLAIKNYQKIVSFLQHENKLSGGAEEERQSLLVAGHLNLALCQLKLGEWLLAKEQSDEALQLEPSNAKGLFRRGQALLGFGEPDRALLDFQEVLRLEPGSAAAAAQVQACHRKRKEQLQKDRQIYANMFDKFARIDQEKEDAERRKQPDVLSTLGEWGSGEGGGCCEGGQAPHPHPVTEEAFNTLGPTIIDTTKYYGCVSD